MLCQNCGKNEVNFRYTQNINGVKKEMALCDQCAKSLGLESLDFNMPINFSSFLGDFLGEPIESSILPNFMPTKTLQCENCGMSYEDFRETGKFGCSRCYDIFADRLNNVLKNIHGSYTHIGRKSRFKKAEKDKTSQNEIQNTQKVKQKQNKEQKLNKTQQSKEEKIKRLNIELKQAIKDERYEDAAKIRDEIKKMSLEGHA